jgi:RsiW-degrading membrane proteinase PrsW (M82 family)
VLFLLIALGPSLFLMLFFYLADRYEPEPLGHVLLAFALGALATAGAALAGWGITSLVGDYWLVAGGLPARAFEALVLGGLVEEGMKWAVFVAVVYRWKELDEPLDGVVYGVALALGFATVENVLYVSQDGLRAGVLRAVFAVPAHALFGSAMGLLLGRAKLGRGHAGGRDVTRRARNLGFFLALAIPTLMHGVYDLLLLELFGRIMYAAVIAGSATLWIVMLRRVRTAREDSPFKPRRPPRDAGPE